MVYELEDLGGRLLAEGVEPTARKRVTKMMDRVSGMAIPPALL